MYWLSVAEISLPPTCSGCQQFDHLSRPTWAAPSSQRCHLATPSIYCCMTLVPLTVRQWHEFGDVLYTRVLTVEVGPNCSTNLQVLTVCMPALCTVIQHHQRQPSHTRVPCGGHWGEASVAVEKEQTDHNRWHWLHDNNASGWQNEGKGREARSISFTSLSAINHECQPLYSLHIM